MAKGRVLFYLGEWEGFADTHLTFELRPKGMRNNPIEYLEEENSEPLAQNYTSERPFLDV